MGETFSAFGRKSGKTEQFLLFVSPSQFLYPKTLLHLDMAHVSLADTKVIIFSLTTKFLTLNFVNSVKEKKPDDFTTIRLENCFV